MVDSVLIEVRPFIKSCNVSIELSQSSNVCVQARNNVLVVGNDRYILENVDLGSPPTIAATRNGKFMSFNSKIVNFTGKSPQKWTFEPSVTANQPVSISCVCGEVLIDNFLFNRVLPLPSFRWESADVFCHGHQKDNVQAFRQRDFLYSTHFFHISRDVLNATDCPKCHDIYGKMYKDYLKIWNSCIRFGPERGEKNLLTDFFPILAEVFFIPSVTWVKILLYTDDNKCVAINVLEKDLQVLRFLKAGEQDAADKVLSQDCMLKVEFSYHEGETELVQGWQNDLSVNSVEVPCVLLQQVLHYLRDVHRQLHPTFDRIGDRLLAYIPCHNFVKTK